jgi:hypothetical protein
MPEMYLVVLLMWGSPDLVDAANPSKEWFLVEV